MRTSLKYSLWLRSRVTIYNQSGLHLAIIYVSYFAKWVQIPSELKINVQPVVILVTNHLSVRQNYYFVPYQKKGLNYALYWAGCQNNAIDVHNSLVNATFGSWKKLC